MKKKIVIFLLGSTFNERHAARIGCDQYQSSNVDFVVWECLFSQSKQSNTSNTCLASYENVLRLTTIKSIGKAFSSLEGRNAIFIDSLGVGVFPWLIRFLINRRGHQIGLLKIQYLLEPQTKSIVSSFKKIRSFNGLIVRIVNLFAKIILPKIRYDFLIFSGSAGYLKSIKKRVETCTFDVATYNCSDVYRHEMSEDDKLGTRYVVFLDNGSYVHPDADICHLYIKGDKAVFSNKLKKCFIDIENKLNAKVIIAAHPKVPKQYYSEYFPEFQVEFNKTSSLVKGALATCMVYSNSMGFAVLSKKPMVIITDDNHLKSYIGDYQKTAAAILGCSLINIDKDVWPIEVLDFQLDKYDNYISTYMSSSQYSKNKTVWLPFIRSLLNNAI